MPAIRFLLDTDIDGVSIPTLSAGRRVAPTELQTARLVRATGGGFVALPSGELTTITSLYLATDRAISVSFNGADASPILLSAGGVLWLSACALTAVAVSNASGSPATLDYLVAG